MDLESIIKEIAALIGKDEVEKIQNLIQEPEEQEIQKKINEFFDKMLK